MYAPIRKSLPHSFPLSLSFLISLTRSARIQIVVSEKKKIGMAIAIRDSVRNIFWKYSRLKNRDNVELS